MSRYRAANDLLVDTWIRYQQFATTFEREVDYWAVLKLEDTCRRDPLEGLNIILAILGQDQHPGIVEALRQGPIQDLLAQESPELHRQIEETAQRNTMFAHLLGEARQA
jgi:hypothetical protein